MMRFLLEKLMPTNKLITINLTRESVCMADDCDAPHSKQIQISSNRSLEAILKEMIRNYLPNMQYEGHYWICKLNGVKVAKIRGDKIELYLGRLELQETNEAQFDYFSGSTLRS